MTDQTAITDPDAQAILATVKKAKDQPQGQYTDPDAQSIMSSVQGAQQAQTTAPQASAQNAPDIQALGQAYWDAAKNDDQAAMQSIYGQIRAAGASLPGPNGRDVSRANKATPASAWDRFKNVAMPYNALVQPGFAVAETHHVANLPLGIGQLLMHGADWAADKISGQPQQNLGNLITGQAPQRTGIAGALDRGTQSLDQYIHNREAQYQHVVPDSGASTAGAAFGEVLPWVTGLGEARALGLLPTLEKLPEDANLLSKAAHVAKKGALLAGEGGLMGALTPATNGKDFGSEKAKQIGVGAVSAPLLAGGVELGGKALGGILSGGRAVYEHFFSPNTVAENEIGKMVGATPEMIARMRAANGSVPGEIIPATQAIPGVQGVQLDRMLRNNPMSQAALAARDAQNNAARLKVITDIAKPPQGGVDSAMEAAKRARDEATQDFTGKYLNGDAPPSHGDHLPAVRWGGAEDHLQALVDSPGRMSSHDFDALKEGAALARKVRQGKMQEDDALSELKDISDSVNSKKAQSAFASAMDSVKGNMVDPEPVLNSLKTLRYGPAGMDHIRAQKLDNLISTIEKSKNINGLTSIAHLDAARQTLGGILGKASKQTETLLSPEYAKIISFIERHAPGYRDYLAAYAKHSQPVNDLEGGRALLTRIDRHSGDVMGDSLPTLADLKDALNKNDGAQYGFSPEVEQALENVFQSIRNRGRLNLNVGAAGSPTEMNRQLAYSRPGRFIFGHPLQGKPGIGSRALGAALGTLIGSHIPLPYAAEAGFGAGMMLPEGVQRINNRIASRMGEIAADPGKTAAALEKVSQRNKPSAFARHRKQLIADPLNYLLYGTPRTLPKP